MPASGETQDDQHPQRGISTRSVRGGERRHKGEDALTTPIFQTATFTFEDSEEVRAYNAGEKQRYEYGRYGNPTVRACELKIASLEGAEDALLFPTGMSAIVNTMLAILRQGHHCILFEDCYRNTKKFCDRYLVKYGVEVSFVRAGDYAQLESEIRDSTRVIIGESPTNPHLRVSDLERLVEISKAHGVNLLLDSTLATPFNQTPADFGVKFVLHSATKYLNGHNDLLGGVLVGAAPQVDAVRTFCHTVGSAADPHQAWMILRGLKTFGLRMERHNHNAMAIAEWLEAHPKVEKVWYPGLASHPDHAVAREQMKGFGGLVSFQVRGDLNQTLRFVDSLGLWLLGPSMGGVESLASHPATVSYYELSRDERYRIGIFDNLIRLAVGIEDAARRPASASPEMLRLSRAQAACYYSILARFRPARVDEPPKRLGRLKENREERQDLPKVVATVPTATQDLFHSLRPSAELLFIRLRSLGDCLLLTGPVRALKQQFPRFRVSVLVEERFRECFSRNSDFEEILTTGSSKYATLRQLSSRRFDAVVNLHGGRTSLIYACAPHGPRIGIDDFRYRFAYSGLIPRGEDRMHTVEKTMEWFRWMGLGAMEAPRLSYASHPEHAAWARHVMGEGPYAVIHPGASLDTKRWSVDGFAALGETLESMGLRSAVTAGPGEEALASRLSQRLPASTVMLDLGLPRLAELIRGAELYLGNDAGPMHLAAAVGTPTVAVWGSSSALRWRPWGVPHRVVQNLLECNPCPGYGCRVAPTPLCIESATVGQVADAVQSLLAETLRLEPVRAGAAGA
jgi:cystathionine gamma-synthase